MLLGLGCLYYRRHAARKIKETKVYVSSPDIVIGGSGVNDEMHDVEGSFDSDRQFRENINQVNITVGKM